MTTWYEMNQQRKINRRKYDWIEGHRRRSQRHFVLLEKTTGEVVVQAQNGCFGRLAELPATREEYDLWAMGTGGEL